MQAGGEHLAFAPRRHSLVVSMPGGPSVAAHALMERLPRWSVIAGNGAQKHCVGTRHRRSVDDCRDCLRVVSCASNQRKQPLGRFHLGRTHGNVRRRAPPLSPGHVVLAPFLGRVLHHTQLDVRPRRAMEAPVARTPSSSVAVCAVTVGGIRTRPSSRTAGLNSSPSRIGRRQSSSGPSKHLGPGCGVNVGASGLRAAVPARPAPAHAARVQYSPNISSAGSCDRQRLRE